MKAKLSRYDVSCGMKREWIRIEFVDFNLEEDGLSLVARRLRKRELFCKPAIQITRVSLLPILERLDAQIRFTHFKSFFWGEDLRASVLKEYRQLVFSSFVDAGSEFISGDDFLLVTAHLQERIAFLKDYPYLRFDEILIPHEKDIQWYIDSVKMMQKMSASDEKSYEDSRPSP